MVADRARDRLGAAHGVDQGRPHGNQRDDADLSKELQAHLAMLVEERVRTGMSKADALRAAHLEMGG